MGKTIVWSSVCTRIILLVISANRTVGNNSGSVTVYLNRGLKQGGGWDWDGPHEVAPGGKAFLAAFTRQRLLYPEVVKHGQVLSCDPVNLLAPKTPFQ